MFEVKFKFLLFQFMIHNLREVSVHIIIFAVKGGVGAWKARGYDHVGWGVSLKYLLFLREIALAVYQRHSTGF